MEITPADSQLACRLQLVPCLHAQSRPHQLCGFKFLGVTTPAESPTMPKHYRGIELSLFEIDLEK